MNLWAGGIGQVFLKMGLTFFLALFVVRIMGNRTVGQMSPFDFVIMVGVGDILVSVAMDKEQSLMSGAEALVGLLVLQQALAYLALKSARLRKWFEGTPVTLIENGKILSENLKQTHFNYDDLRQELHKQGVDFTNLKDIKLARLESCGDFSLIKRPMAEPLSAEALQQIMNDIYANPLSPLGRQVARLEKLMNDMENVLQGSSAAGQVQKQPFSDGKLQ